MALDSFGIARSEIDLFDFVKRAGIDYSQRGRVAYISCFHADGLDDNPSLAVFVEESKFYCFHCGWHGTIVDFVMGFLGTKSPLEALKYLDKMYPDLGLIDPERKSVFEKLSKFWASQEAKAQGDNERLLATDKVLSHLKAKRHLSDLSIERFRVGLTNTGKYPRLSIPQMGSDGRVLSFVTRALFEPDPLPKYLSENVYLDPATGKQVDAKELRTGRTDLIPVFSKRDYLYNLNNVKSHEIVLVEGQFDVIAGWEMGVDNMACYGTKFISDEQSQQLDCFDEVILVPDLDAIDAVKENVETIRRFNPNMSIRIVNLRNIDTDIEKDVGDALVVLDMKDAIGGFKKAVEAAIPVEFFLFNKEVMPLLESSRSKAYAKANEILALSCQATVEQSKLVSLIADAFEMDPLVLSTIVRR